MTREEIKKAMSDTKKEVVLKNLHKLLSLVEGYPEYEDCVGYAIEELEQEPTPSKVQTIDYRRAFKIACDLLNGCVLYGVDADRIFEIMMDRDGVVASNSYEEYILNHLQELDQGQYAEVGE